MMSFGRSFIRGFGWGLGRGLAYEATRPRTRRKRRGKDAQPVALPIDWRVLDWIMEAIAAYRAMGIEPNFEQIQAHVQRYHNYTLAR